MLKYFLFISSFVIAFKNSVAQSPLPKTHHKIIVIAHRGDHVEVPENTLAAYTKAIEHGVDYVEIDLRTTKDGRLVIMHDATVDRMTNGEGKVNELTYDDIKKLKVSDKNNPSTKAYTVPLFSDVLALCKGRINIYLDFKEADPAVAYQQIKHAHMEHNIIVYLNKDEQYAQWQQAAPKMPLMCSLPDSVKNATSLQQFLTSFKVTVTDGSLSDYNDDMLQVAADNNVGVWLDVQSSNEGPADWDKLLSKGIKAMQTDHPEKLIQYLEEKGVR